MTFEEFPDIAPVYDMQTRRRRCTHAQTEMLFPSGAVVYGSSSWAQKQFTPDMGLWLDPAPVAKANSVSLYIPWADHGLPTCSWDWVRGTILAAYLFARNGNVLEVGCYAGHGRTATVLSCMVRADDPTVHPIDWVREHYCPNAVQELTHAQVEYVERFEP